MENDVMRAYLRDPMPRLDLVIICHHTSAKAVVWCQADVRTADGRWPKDKGFVCPGGVSPPAISIRTIIVPLSLPRIEAVIRRSCWFKHLFAVRTMCTTFVQRAGSVSPHQP
jgi:hypothetical protein